MIGTAEKRVTSAAERFSTHQFFCVQWACASLIAAIFGKHSGESARSDSLIRGWRSEVRRRKSGHTVRRSFLRDRSRAAPRLA
jgi:hypothetical protein